MVNKTSFIVIVASIWMTLSAYADTPKENLGLLKLKLERYHDSGQYDKDISAVIAKAQHDLAAHIQHHQHATAKPAIVLDIDETSLSNYPTLKKLNFGGTKEEISQSDEITTDPAIVPTRALYRFAEKHHIAVIFLTGRLEKYRSYTIKNLHRAGYTHWDKLILRDTKNETNLAEDYKSTIRKQLTLAGYDIILNIGDQDSDLIGGYAEHAYKLPNPYYYIP